MESVVPVRILTGHMILIPATINRSHASWFILDTGASQTTISKALAQKTKLPIVGKSSIWGDGEAEYSVPVTHAVLQAGNLSVSRDYLMDDISAVEETLGTKIGGVLGLDVFKECVLEIDYTKASVLIHSPETYHYLFRRRTDVRMRHHRSTSFSVRKGANRRPRSRGNFRIGLRRAGIDCIAESSFRQPAWSETPGIPDCLYFRPSCCWRGNRTFYGAW